MKLGFVFMASGFGRRFGSNKLMHDLAGKPVYKYALESLFEAACELKKNHILSLAVVSQYSEILADAEKSGLTAVFNSLSETGITSSIKLGIENLPPAEKYAFFVADQPYLKPETTVNFIEAYLESGKTIGCVSSDNAFGNPVIFDRLYLPELLALEGDRGGKRVVMEHLSEVFSFPVEKEELTDIDAPSDIKK